MDYPIKGFIETSFSDWPGKVASVLFLPSCNFRCPFCHNSDLVLSPEKYPDIPLREILESIRKRRGWIDGVCLTGGEPTLHPWLPSLIQDLKSAEGLTPPGVSLGIKLDTNGTHPGLLQRLMDEGLVDYVAMDLKAPLEESRYATNTGVSLKASEPARIAASAQILLNGAIDYEFRTTLVPSLIQEEDVYALAHWVRGARRYTLQRFNPRETLDERLRTVVPFDEQTFRRMQAKVDEILRLPSSN